MDSSVRVATLLQTVKVSTLSKVDRSNTDQDQIVYERLQYHYSGEEAISSVAQCAEITDLTD
ncbi:hypothetical protein C0993_008844 [Termitomyces sp. T159_Od127]|nr:hypothetical protein C0993_008844 [Termitomyces sp. T159_Od127]